MDTFVTKYRKQSDRVGGKASATTLIVEIGELRKTKQMKIFKTIAEADILSSARYAQLLEQEGVSEEVVISFFFFFFS